MYHNNWPTLSSGPSEMYVIPASDHVEKLLEIISCDLFVFQVAAESPCTREPRLPLNDFGRQEYWDRRFQVETESYSYDWYFGFDAVADLFLRERDLSSPGALSSSVCFLFQKKNTHCPTHMIQSLVYWIVGARQRKKNRRNIL